jgi:hypothetical protein
MDEKKLWDIRAFVYHHLADTTLAPSVDEFAAHFLGACEKEDLLLLVYLPELVSNELPSKPGSGSNIYAALRKFSS